MATISSIALRLAKRVTTVRTSITTASTTTSISDSVMRGMGKWTDGVLWILGGTYVDTMRDVESNPKDKLTFAVYAGAPGTGVSYAVADEKVGNRGMLISAVNEGLRLVKPRLTENDSGLTVDATVQVYTLPANVSDLVKVEIAAANAAPYYWNESRHWDEVDGELRFANGYHPQNTGNKIRLTYIPAFTYEDDEAADLELTAKQEEGVYWKALDELAGYLTDLRPQGDDGKRLADLRNEALARWAQYSTKHITPQRAGKFADW